MLHVMPILSLLHNNNKTLHYPTALCFMIPDVLSVTISRRIRWTARVAQKLG
jgi:hypothetical protein